MWTLSILSITATLAVVAIFWWILRVNRRDLDLINKELEATEQEEQNGGTGGTSPSPDR